MDADLYERLRYELKILRRDREEISSRLDELESYRHCKLKKNRHSSGKNYYYIQTETAGGFTYARKKDMPRVFRIQEAAHLEESLRQIAKNLELTQALLDGYLSYDFLTVDKRLPMAYQNSLDIITSPYIRKGRQWKEEKLILMNSFPENYPEHKNEKASDGTMMKSKNEVIIYEKLIDAGLFTLYELPLPMEDHGPPLYPDFTILSPIDMRTELLIEHIGNLDDQSYREGFVNRLRRYIRNGYIPGVNLFFTFNDRYGHIDAFQITKLIADIYGIR